MVCSVSPDQKQVRCEMDFSDRQTLLGATETPVNDSLAVGYVYVLCMCGIV